MTNPLTEAVWAARGPSILTRKPGDDRTPRVDPDEEPKQTRAMVPGSTHKLLVDVEGIVQMRRQGYEWKAISKAFDCAVSTCRSRVREVEPALLATKRRGSASPKPGSQIVIRNQADADKTAHIKGTGGRP